MYSVTIAVADRQLDDAAFARWVETGAEALASANQEHAQRGELPDLYSSGVRYRFKSDEQIQRWRDAKTILSEDGCAACAELAAWRVAELRAQGVPACARVAQTDTDMFHVVVIRGDTGEVEDPSLALGM